MQCTVQNAVLLSVFRFVFSFQLAAHSMTGSSGQRYSLPGVQVPSCVVVYSVTFVLCMRSAVGVRVTGRMPEAVD